MRVSWRYKRDSDGQAPAVLQEVGRLPVTLVWLRYNWVKAAKHPGVPHADGRVPAWVRTPRHQPKPTQLHTVQWPSSTDKMQLVLLMCKLWLPGS